MRVQLSAAAERDLTAAFLFVGQDNPRAARTIRSAIRNAILSLRHFPNRGRPALQPGLRELVVARTAYVLVYQVEEEQVVITRIRHTSQDPSP